MSEKIYRVQMNSKGMPNFSTAVEVADRPQGEWFKDENGDYRCSECGGCEEQFIYGTENWYGVGESKFCPSCGARMKGQTMTDLIPWEDFIETKGCQFANAEPTQIACPKCGNRIYKRTDIILACYPPKHQYFCGKCDWVGNA